MSPNASSSPGRYRLGSAVGLLACQWLPIFVGQKAAFKAVHNLNLKARVVNSLGCHRADL